MALPRFLTALPVHQFLNQLVFLTAGKVVYRLSVTWEEIGLILLSAVVLEHAFEWLRAGRVKAFSTAALSTGFNLAFMLGSTSFLVYLAALAIGLGQKHLARKAFGSHFQNPSNVGIIAALLIWPDYTYITFLDWGQTRWLALVIALLGSFILWRVGRLIMPFAFLAAWGLFSWLLHTRDPWALWLELNTAAFLLYAFFMITDPKTVPSTRTFQAVHAVLAAFLGVALSLALGPKEVNLFLALLLTGFFVPLWRRIETRLPQPRRRAVFAGSLGLIAVAVTALYLSPLNLVRTSISAYARTSLLAPLPPDSFSGETGPYGKATSDQVWQGTRAEEYLVAWTTSTVLRIPLEKTAESTRRFRAVAQALPPYPTAITDLTLGNDTNLWAGVAVGDLNLDGALDIVLAKIGRPLLVAINQGGGRFLDATDLFFPQGAPESVEHMALADFDGDGRLDMLVVPSIYYGATASTLYLFDTERRVFVEHDLPIAPGRHSSGGISVFDINNDGRLDFYISYAVQWWSEAIDQILDSDADAFYVSTGDTWREAIDEYFPPDFTHPGFAGMTAQFVDYNGDGHVDFLLGNDFEDPSITLVGGPDGFRIADPKSIENNTKNSMSYFAADFDNDGVAELWENGISEEYTTGRRAFTKEWTGIDRTLLNEELAILEKQNELGNFVCEEVTHPLANTHCRDLTILNAVQRGGNEKRCDRIAARSYYHLCRKIVFIRRNAVNVPPPSAYKYDVERFPKQLKENVLLKWNERDRRWANVLKDNDEAQFTGFTFAAYPYDIDNDGRLDLYIGNGFLAESHDANRMLVNRSTDGRIRFADEAADWGVALEDDARGLVIADFDGDGDGDLLVNNYLSPPLYFENRLGGSNALLVDLRAHGNYHGIGARLTLHWKEDEESGKVGTTSTGKVQTRFVTLGGYWNASQPTRQHFALPPGVKAAALEVRWPDGSTSTHEDIRPGYRYVIYQ